MGNDLYLTTPWRSYGNSAIVTATVTLSSGSLAHRASSIVGDTSGSPVTVSGIARENGATFHLRGIEIETSGSGQTWVPVVHYWMSQPTTPGADGAFYQEVYADQPIKLLDYTLAALTSGSNGPSNVSKYMDHSLNHILQAGTGTRDICLQLTTNTAFTSTPNQTIKIKHYVDWN